MATAGSMVNLLQQQLVQVSTGTDNNGNLLRQETSFPGSGFFDDNFTYDGSIRELNTRQERRLLQARCISIPKTS
jgi:hypothetical protein